MLEIEDNTLEKPLKEIFKGFFVFMLDPQINKNPDRIFHLPGSLPENILH